MDKWLEEWKKIYNKGINIKIINVRNLKPT